LTGTIDSNDERNEANDYPDEEDDDVDSEGEKLLRDDLDDGDEYDRDTGSSDDGEDRRYLGRSNRHMRSLKGSHVMKYHVADDPMSLEEKDTDQLQQLWGFGAHGASGGEGRGLVGRSGLGQGDDNDDEGDADADADDGDDDEDEGEEEEDDAASKQYRDELIKKLSGSMEATDQTVDPFAGFHVRHGASSASMGAKANSRVHFQATTDGLMDIAKDPSTFAGSSSKKDSSTAFAGLPRGLSVPQSLAGSKSKGSGGSKQTAVPMSAHQTRLAGMHEVSGLQFGARPKEFDRRGLPKYGHDLSSDDEDVFGGLDAEDERQARSELLGVLSGIRSPQGAQAMDVSSSAASASSSSKAPARTVRQNWDFARKPPPTTVAYDPELDAEDDDDDDDGAVIVGSDGRLAFDWAEARKNALGSLLREHGASAGSLKSKAASSGPATETTTAAAMDEGDD
jgi:hypothetical protein